MIVVSTVSIALSPFMSKRAADAFDIVFYLQQTRLA